MLNGLKASIERQWYGRPHWLFLLLPLEAVFRLLAARRRKHQQRAAQKPSVPVWVVGNIAVGGTGKTPVLIAIVNALQVRGHRPGVVSRGFGATVEGSLLVDAQTPAHRAGDEPVLIARGTGAPVVVGRDRVAAAERLQRENNCDVILSDDGLQHYRLARNLELVVVDGSRGLGNGHCLPVGPLREPARRLKEASMVLINGRGAFTHPGAVRFELKPRHWRNVATGEVTALADLCLDGAVAIAGIGNPGRFFATLEALGFTGPTRAFTDHHAYSEADLAEFSAYTLLMTGKDAVKCEGLVGPNAWALQVDADLPDDFYQHLIAELEK